MRYEQINPRRYAASKFLREAFEGFDAEGPLERYEYGLPQDIVQMIISLDMPNELYDVVDMPDRPELFVRLPTYAQNALLSHAQQWWRLDVDLSDRLNMATRDSVDSLYGYGLQWYEILEMERWQPTPNLADELTLDVGRLFALNATK